MQDNKKECAYYKACMLAPCCGFVVKFLTSPVYFWTINIKSLNTALVNISVWLRTAGPGDRGSIPQQRQEDFFSSLCVQTCSGAHPASCTMGTGGAFPGGKTQPRRNSDRITHLVPRQWMSRSYASSSPCAYIGVPWDYNNNNNNNNIIIIINNINSRPR
jgi:hypothetical protein